MLTDSESTLSCTALLAGDTEPMGCEYVDSSKPERPKISSNSTAYNMPSSATANNYLLMHKRRCFPLPLPPISLLIALFGHMGGDPFKVQSLFMLVHLIQDALP